MKEVKVNVVKQVKSRYNFTFCFLPKDFHSYFKFKVHFNF